MKIVIIDQSRLEIMLLRNKRKGIFLTCKLADDILDTCINCQIKNTCHLDNFNPTCTIIGDELNLNSFDLYFEIGNKNLSNNEKIDQSR